MARSASRAAVPRIAGAVVGLHVAIPVAAVGLIAVVAADDHDLAVWSALEGLPFAVAVARHLFFKFHNHRPLSTWVNRLGCRPFLPETRCQRTDPCKHGSQACGVGRTGLRETCRNLAAPTRPPLARLRVTRARRRGRDSRRDVARISGAAHASQGRQLRRRLPDARRLAVAVDPATLIPELDAAPQRGRRRRRPAVGFRRRICVGGTAR